MKKVCVFIDGENLRYSLMQVLNKWENSHYIPHLDWKKFFLQTIRKSKDELNVGEFELLRVYWYVVAELSYNTYFASSKFKYLKSKEKLDYFKKFAPSAYKPQCEDKEKNSSVIKNCFDLLEKNQQILENRFKSWKDKESGIQKNINLLQFQKSGHLKAILDNNKGTFSFKGEKGVDIKLATDLITLKDNYEVAIIISGDGDYIPAIKAVKNMGKIIGMVSFKNNNGKFFPGGSKKLVEHCDFSIHFDCKEMNKYVSPPIIKN